MACESKGALLSLRNSKIGFLNPKESENGFYVSLLNRSIQDFSDHGASKEPKNPFKSGFFGSFDAPRSERSWIDLFSKETQIPFRILSDLRIKPLIFLKSIP